MDRQFLEELERITGDGRLLRHEPMSRHTTFQVGGEADVFVRPDEENLSRITGLCARYGVEYHIIGNGSNLLVGDGGIRGVVIGMTGMPSRLLAKGALVTAGAGMLLAKTAAFAAEQGLCGMEFAAGIPGSVGGAVVMNAGAYGGEIKDILEKVVVLGADGRRQELGAAELELGYRRSCIPERHLIVLEAVFRLASGDSREIQAKIADLRDRRRDRQPLEYPSAGSTFKRPEGYFAGKLIMDAGFKGCSVGGAQVSEKHCGFIVNRGGATAQDIRALIRKVTDGVEAHSGVRLEPEIKMIGEFPE